MYLCIYICVYVLPYFWKRVNKPLLRPGLAPGSCTVEYKQLFLLLFSLAQTHFSNKKAEFYNSHNTCSRIVLVFNSALIVPEHGHDKMMVPTYHLVTWFTIHIPLLLCFVFLAWDILIIWILFIFRPANLDVLYIQSRKKAQQSIVSITNPV